MIKGLIDKLYFSPLGLDIKKQNGTSTRFFAISLGCSVKRENNISRREVKQNECNAYLSSRI